ncbi:uncharacterized protein LOC144354876 [Saccoglossus kowalevskii]
MNKLNEIKQAWDTFPFAEFFSAMNYILELYPNIVQKRVAHINQVRFARQLLLQNQTRQCNTNMAPKIKKYLNSLYRFEAIHSRLTNELSKVRSRLISLGYLENKWKLNIPMKKKGGAEIHSRVQLYSRKVRGKSGGIVSSVAYGIEKLELLVEKLPKKSSRRPIQPPPPQPVPGIPEIPAQILTDDILQDQFKKRLKILRDWAKKEEAHEKNLELALMTLARVKDDGAFLSVKGTGVSAFIPQRDECTGKSGDVYVALDCDLYRAEDENTSTVSPIVILGSENPITEPVLLTLPLSTYNPSEYDLRLAVVEQNNDGGGTWKVLEKDDLELIHTTVPQVPRGLNFYWLDSINYTTVNVQQLIILYLYVLELKRVEWIERCKFGGKLCASSSTVISRTDGDLQCKIDGTSNNWKPEEQLVKQIFYGKDLWDQGGTIGRFSTYRFNVERTTAEGNELRATVALRQKEVARVKHRQPWIFNTEDNTDDVNVSFEETRPDINPAITSTRVLPRNVFRGLCNLLDTTLPDRKRLAKAMNLNDNNIQFIEKQTGSTKHLLDWFISRKLRKKHSPPDIRDQLRNLFQKIGNYNARKIMQY